MKDNIISELFHTLKRRPELQAVIPMGYTPGLPMLNIRQDNLCVEIPFLRYKVTGEKDRTLVYPVRYVATYLVPEMQMIRFTDLAFTPAAAKVDFNRPVGYFRHQAIAHLNRREYDSLRSETLAALDRVALSMLGQAPEDSADDAALASRMSVIVEPSLYPFYKAISPLFFNKYIGHGQN